MAFVVATGAIAALTVVASALTSTDWSAIAPHLVALIIMAWLLHWLMTLVPGPIKKVGKAAGKRTWKWIHGTDGRQRGR